MIKIHNFNDYKEYLNSYILGMPKKGRGQFLSLSKHLNVHPTLISQVLRSDKDFTTEQIYKVADYFSLNELETDYLMLLLQISKAGNYELKNYYSQKLTLMQERFKEVKSRIKAKKELNESDKALYYSDWSYIAIWLSSGIKEIQSENEICEYLNLPLNRVKTIVSFLEKVGLIKIENNKITMGETRTHLDRKNILINRHHTNWRLKSIERLEYVTKEELVFTAPLTISKKDFSYVKKEILNLIESISERVTETTPETLACLNIDFIKLR